MMPRFALLAASFLAGCAVSGAVRLEPIEVEPLHVSMTVARTESDPFFVGLEPESSDPVAPVGRALGSVMETMVLVVRCRLDHGRWIDDRAELEACARTLGMESALEGVEEIEIVEAAADRARWRIVRAGSPGEESTEAAVDLSVPAGESW